MEIFVLSLFENWEAILAIFFVIGSVWFYLHGDYSMMLVSVGILAALFIVFSVIPSLLGGEAIVNAEEILSGFGNKALLAVMALLVVGQGLYITGAVAAPSNWLIKHHAQHPRLVLFATFAFIFAVSAFINNTPVVIIFLPILSAMAQKMNDEASRLLMPLSFVTILAGMTTLIGTSTNLLAAEAYELAIQKGNSAPGYGFKIQFFDQTPYGLVLAAIGLIYVALFGRLLLPKRKGLTEAVIQERRTQFIAQFEIPAGSKLVGGSAASGLLGDVESVKIRLIQRGQTALIPPFKDTSLKEGDQLVVAAPRSQLSALLKKFPELLTARWDANSDTGDGEVDTNKLPPDLQVIEAVIAPGSRITNLSLGLVGFSARKDVLTLGIQRRNGMVRAALSELRLLPGDTLLLAGAKEAFDKLRQDRDLILMESTKRYLPTTNKANSAIAITMLMILVAAFNLVDISSAAFLGAAAMVMTGCLNSRQASRALDLDIYIIVGSALALGAVLVQTGASDLIASGLVALTLPYGPYAVLSAIFLLVAVFTNLLSNAATAVIFTPLAVSASQTLGVEPFPFFIAVILASNCCFATPFAYQTNLLVMGPARYEFKDFLRFGGPLTLLIWISFTIFAPMVFQF